MDRTAPDCVVISPAALTSLVRECFEGVGVRTKDAAAVAEVLVDANLHGLDAHGFARVPIYMRRVRAGLTRGTERVTVVSEHGAMRCLDARQALGPAVAMRATDESIDLARMHGVGLVAVGNSTHFGAGGFYARRVAERGMLAIVATNGPANMAPHGASERFLGTNALAIAAPLGRHGELVLDMASSIAARGSIIRAAALGHQIPLGLAIDVEGRPTQDPVAALAGAVLPMAGPKGSGLALAISVFAAILGGADFDYQLAPMYGQSERAQNVGHFFIAIDPAYSAGGHRNTARAEELIDRLHALRRAPGHDGVRFPGEGAAARARERAGGIPLARAELETAAAECEACGLQPLAERFRRYLVRAS